MTDNRPHRRWLQTIKAYANRHRPGRLPNVFISAVPRSGSTWLMELILTQPGFKPCSEPLDVRNADVRAHSGFPTWVTLYNASAEPALERYLAGFIDGRLRFKNHSPRLPGYRPLTHRIVFKLLHGGEDRLPWLAQRFNGRIVLLLRHPLPVSLSRRQLPRLHAYLKSDYQDRFSAEQLAHARAVVADGDPLACGVLSWCLQTAVPLRDRQPDWTVITYEQLVLDPRPVVETLARNADLPAPQRMLRRIDRASTSTDQSDRLTRRRLQQPRSAAVRRWLVDKWRARVDADAARRAMAQLPLFGLDVYSAESTLPAPAYWLPGGTRPADPAEGGAA